MARPAVPGGLTEQINAAGGEELFRAIAVALAGADIRLCVYALTRAMSNVALNINDLEAAKALLLQMSDDAISEVELNWPDRARLIGNARASFQRVAGNG